MSDSKKTLSLEDSLTEIGELIAKMEKNDLSLEQSLSSFERGISLIKHCQKILCEAEHKVQILMQNDEQQTLVDFQELKEQGLVANENSNE